MTFITSRLCAKITVSILALLISLQPSCMCLASPDITLADTPSPNLTAAAIQPPIAKLADAIPAPLNQEDAQEQSVLNGRIGTVDPATAASRVDDLTRKILLKEIELERFNMHYSLEAAKQGRWKGWRYAFFNEANATLGLTGAIIGTAERGSHIYSPAKVHNSMQQNACFIPMIGAIIGAGAAVLELGINEYHEILASQHGFSPKKAIAYVKNLKREIEALLVERETLIASEASSDKFSLHARIDEAEGRVLKDLLAQGLLEFERFHVGARRLLAFQQMQYLFDFTKNVTNAIGYDFAFLSLHRHRRVWNYRAGVLFLVSGGLFIGGPIASRLFGKAVAEMEKRKLKTTVGDAHDASIAVLNEDQAALDKLCKSGIPDAVETPLNRLALYGSHEKHFADQMAKSEKQRNKAKLVATQNIGAAMYVGGTKVASGVLFVVPGYSHLYNNSSLRASRMTNDYLFISSVISIPSSVFTMVDTLRIQVSGEINRHKQLKAGVHPSQLAKARLAQLDDMEQKLNAMGGSK